VAVDAVSKVSCIIRTDHRDGGRDAFLVLSRIINQDMDGRSCDCNDAAAKLGILSSVIIAKLLGEDAVSARHTIQTFVLAAQCVGVVASSMDPLVLPPDLSVIRREAHPERQRVDNIGTTLGWRLHATVLAGEAELRICGSVFAHAVVLPKDALGARHARRAPEAGSDMANAAHRGDLEASCPVPIVGRPHLPVVLGHAMSEGTQILEIGALRRLIGSSHTAVLTSDRADCHAYNFELHAPTTSRIRPRGTDLRSAARDLERVTSWVGVDAVAQMSSIIGTLDCSVN
jgi:hypothetical protein